METSYLVAKLIAVVYLFAGIGFLVNPDRGVKMVKEMLGSAVFTVLGGMMATIVGVLLITYHNVWEGPWWVVLITIIGWISLVKGFFYLVYPKAFDMFLPWYKKEHMPKWGMLMVVVGLVFGYYGFLA